MKYWTMPHNIEKNDKVEDVVLSIYLHLSLIKYTASSLI